MLFLGDCLTMTSPDHAGAVAVDGERIVAVGSAAELAARFPGMRRVRVERVTPGVHDAHAHPLFWGQALAELDCSGLTDPRDVAARVAARARELPEGAWIRGRGLLFDAYPTGPLLDEAAPRNPVLLDSRDIHSAWANAAALRLAGIGRDTLNPEGGAILRAADGAPTGYLLERAADLVRRVLPPPARADLERGLADLAGRGYTAVHAMAYAGFDDVEWLEALAASHTLPLRVWCAVPAGRFRSVAPGWRGEDLEVAAVKMFVDGALGSRTAWMKRPYADGSLGIPLDSREALLGEGLAALEAGYTLAIHAIGTRATAEVLDIVTELAPRAQRRIRIEHLQHLDDDDAARLAGLPAAASMQPVHLPGDAELVRRHLPGREREAFRFRDVVAAGIPLAFGSDAPVARPDVAAGIRAAMAHALDPDQSLTPAEALHAFTRGAALAAGWEGYGVLAPGARADLGLWEHDRLVGRVFRGRLEWLGPGSR